MQRTLGLALGVLEGTLCLSLQVAGSSLNLPRINHYISALHGDVLGSAAQPHWQVTHSQLQVEVQVKILLHGCGTGSHRVAKETHGVVILDDLVKDEASEHCCHADGDVLHRNTQV